MNILTRLDDHHLGAVGPRIMQHPGKRFARYTRNISIFWGWGDGSRIQLTAEKTPDEAVKCYKGLSLTAIFTSLSKRAAEVRSLLSLAQLATNPAIPL